MLTFSTENLRNVFSEEGKYENFKKLCYDLIRGNDIYEYDKDGVEKRVSKAKANEAIRKVFMEVCGLTKEDLQSRKKRRRAEEKHKNEIFEIIEEEIDFRVNEGYQESEWFNALVDERNLALGDAPEFTTESKALFIVGDYSGDNHDITMQQLPAGQAQTLKTSPKTVKIGKDIDLIILGRIDYADWIQTIADSFVQYTQTMAYNGMLSAEAKLPAECKGTGTLGASTKGDFDDLLEEVSIRNGSDVVIMGTKTALKKLNALADVTWASEKQKEQMNDLGRLGSYEGTTMIEIPQRLSLTNSNTKLITNGKLFIIPAGTDKFVKFVYSGETEIREVTEKGDHQDDFETYEITMDMGTDVILGQYFGVWTF
jgi:hypothetical protein